MVQTEILRQEFSQRLAQALKEAGYPEHGRGLRLAGALGVTSKAVSKWLTAESMPRPAMMEQLAKLLRVDPLWLQHGVKTTAESNVTGYRAYAPSSRYPVLSKVQAGSWAEACEPYTLKDVDLWLESDAHTQGESFWLEVDGDSMTSPHGLSIPEGTFVLFDTGREPVNGSLVVAKLVDDNEATFKKLVIDGSQKYLRGLNPQWPMVPINGNCKIIGVAIETKLRLI